jgi:hypothetical protein
MTLHAAALPDVRGQMPPPKASHTQISAPKAAHRALGSTGLTLGCGWDAQRVRRGATSSVSDIVERVYSRGKCVITLQST